MEREVLPDGVRIFDDRGSASIRRPRPHVEHLVARGFANVEAVGLILEQRERIVAECGKIALFDDLEGLVGYDSEVRVRLTDWSRANRPKIVAFHILTSSRIVAMGVTVANLALGGSIRAHLKRMPFEAALRDEVLRGATLDEPRRG
jgi:hypothetical protein